MADRRRIEQTLFCGDMRDANRRSAQSVDWQSTRLLGLLPLLIALLATGLGRELRAEAPKAKIVGLGATTCEQFNADVKSKPGVRRDYLAWAQGYMSGILVGRPPSVDQGLDLNPAAFDLVSQLQFLEDHCARNNSADFSDAVEALYKRLRKEGKT